MNTAGQIDSYSRNGNSRLHPFAYCANSKSMETIQINEQHLGTEATVTEAHEMVKLLVARGYDVQYGDKIRREDDENVNAIPDEVWAECMNQVMRDFE